MIKEDLIKEISIDSNCTVIEATKMLDAVLSTIKKNLILKQPIAIRNFGQWKINNKKARMGRNPKTGELAEITARTTVTFKSSQALNRIINNG